jgi:hypothetical protein
MRLSRERDYTGSALPNGPNITQLLFFPGPFLARGIAQQGTILIVTLNLRYIWRINISVCYIQESFSTQLAASQHTIVYILGNPPAVAQTPLDRPAKCGLSQGVLPEANASLIDMAADCSSGSQGHNQMHKRRMS